jgi:hypothetical protein
VFIFLLWLFARARNSRLVRILTAVALVLKFAARVSNREIDEEIKSQAIRHISCDKQLYKSLRNRGNLGGPVDWDNGFEKMI